MAEYSVCGGDLDERSPPEPVEYEGETYDLCRKGCKEKFDNNPEQYT